MLVDVRLVYVGQLQVADYALAANEGAKETRVVVAVVVVRDLVPSIVRAQAD